MPTYTENDLDGLEEAAENASPDHQTIALEFVAGVLEENSITYGVMGGMNFYLRGSGRATGDVDIAVDNPPRMGDLLTVFDNQERLVPRSSPSYITHSLLTPLPLTYYLRPCRLMNSTAFC